MNTEEAIELITQNYSASEGSLIFSLHERNTFSSRQFWDLYDSIDTVVNASHHNDELTEQISSCYQAILKMLIWHFDANDLFTIECLPYDYPWYIDCLDYAGLCNTAESMDHAEPLRQFSDLLNDENLLPEDHAEEDLLKIYEDPYAISDQLFYSFYYYAKIVLSEVPDILDYYKCYPDESKELRRRTENIPL